MKWCISSVTNSGTIGFSLQYADFTEMGYAQLKDPIWKICALQ
jgi:hypothetical protein